MKELNIVEKILNIVPIKNLIFISLVSSSILLFASDWLLEKIYLKDFKEINGFGIGITFLISSVYCICCFIFDFIIPIVDKVRLRKGCMDYLSTIRSKSEINIIANFLKVDNNTLYLSYHDGSVHVLRNKGIICPVSSSNTIDISNPKIAYFMQPIVFDIINDNDKLKKKFSVIYEELDNESPFI